MTKLDARSIEEHFGDLLIESLEQALAYAQGDPYAPVRVVVREDQESPDRTDALSAERVRRVRSTLGVSVSDFARALNVSVATVRAWERGSRRPSASALRLLQLAELAPEWISESLGELGLLTSDLPAASDCPR